MAGHIVSPRAQLITTVCMTIVAAGALLAPSIGIANPVNSATHCVAVQARSIVNTVDGCISQYVSTESVQFSAFSMVKGKGSRFV